MLLSEDWRAKVSDLGMAQVLAHSARTAVGFSRVYAAPEQLMGQRCTLAADMCACPRGCLPPEAGCGGQGKGG